MRSQRKAISWTANKTKIIINDIFDFAQALVG